LFLLFFKMRNNRTLFYIAVVLSDTDARNFVSERKGT
jgi:hypothetical protein